MLSTIFQHPPPPPVQTSSKCRPEERVQHPRRVPPLPLHLRRHRRPALQWKVLLLQRPQQGRRRGVPVRLLQRIS